MRGAFLIAAAAVLLATAAPAGAQQTIALEPGASAFWAGPVNGAATCGERCWEYALDVRPGGERLRVGVDHATVGDVWTMEVDGPEGVASTFGPGEGLYSNEAVFRAPAAGRWSVRVTATPEVTDLRFRARAKLEAGPPALPAGPVPPNLQALPPYMFNFQLPVTNGTTDGAPTGLPLPGGRVSCHPEEVAEEAAQRCLRMAFGVRNTGQAPMQLFYEDGVALEDRELMQRVVAADGSHFDRVAGVAKFHKTHQHYHHDKAIGLTLWKVTDAGLEAAAPEHLKGFAHRNEMLREWTVFYPLWDDFGFGLRAGWGDYYEWDRPGNYIDFGLNGDGRYVVRIVADPVGGILESNEADNSSYSLIEVTGGEVELLESGRGTDPWDRCKILVPEGAEPDLPAGLQPPRPADCPPDTIDAPPAPAVAPPPVPASAPAPAAAKRKPAAKRSKCARKRRSAKRKAAKRRAVKRCARKRRRAHARSL